MRTLLRPVLASLLALAPATGRGQEPCHTTDAVGVKGRLGTVAFPNSGAEVAQAAFLRGVALLHSFAYTDAAETFRAAQDDDPAFALAYWLEALTYRHPLWGEEDLDAARAALARLGPTPEARLARAPTPRERGYGAAVEALYAADDETARARAFADALRALAGDSGDPEAATFASVAVQGLALLRPPEEQPALLDEAAALAGRVFAVNRDHPGAAHYLIHAYDTPARAAGGLEAARVYAGIAPAAQHALHMPSHIFVQLGMWDDAVSSNEAAWAASRAWVARRGAAPAEHDFHSLTWLQYAYLQQGRYREAHAILDTARAVLGDRAAGDYADADYAAAWLAFQYAAETGQWEVAPSAPTASPIEGRTRSRRAQTFAAMHTYQVGVAGVLRGDTAVAGASARRLRAMAAALPPDAPPRDGLTNRAVQLDALAARTTGDRERALALLQEAATWEERVPPLGPPTVIPTHELLGAALLDVGRPAESAAAYARALERRPNRPATLLGLARARAAAGDAAGATEAYRQLRTAWHRADVDLPALAEVREGAGD